MGAKKINSIISKSTQNSEDSANPLITSELGISDHDFRNRSIILSIHRPIINQTSLYANHNNNGPSEDIDKENKLKSSAKKMLKRCDFSSNGLKNWFFGLFPILHWLPKYNYKSDLSYDLIAGFTVAVFNIPQGMAYSLLANLPPIIGIYMAFFPVIVYAIMGTSKHLAVGTFAVVSLMSGQVILSQVALHEAQLRESGHFNGTSTSDEIHEELEHFAIEVGTALSFVVGFWQVLLGMLKMGSISVLLFPELVSGFTTGAAFHVVTSQVKSLFGLKLPRHSGFFNIILTYISIIKNITESNITSIIISAITIVFLVIYNEFLKPRIAKKIPFPLPIELIIIIIGTLVSRYTDLAGNYNLSIVGKIPKGVPHPEFPLFPIVGNVIVNGLLIAIVSYAISVSVAKIFAQKHGYKIDPNQELLAHGSSNVIGSFFNCFPSSASLTRCVINETVGARTQMAGLFCAGILLVVLLWIAPFFETVPNCVLSAMIVVALKGMFLQVYDLPKAWKQSRINGGIWLLTFLSTIILDIEYGLAVGLILSILSLVWRSNRPYVQVLGAYDKDTGLYVDIKKGKEMVKELSGIKIIKYIGGLNFATSDYFLKNINNIVPLGESLVKQKIVKDAKTNESSVGGLETVVAADILCNIHSISINDIIHWIILDLSSVSSIDPTSSKGLQGLCKDYESVDKRILFAGISTPVLENLIACDLVGEIGEKYFFPTIHDAVLYAQSHNDSQTLQVNVQIDEKVPI